MAIKFKSAAETKSKKATKAFTKEPVPQPVAVVIEPEPADELKKPVGRPHSGKETITLRLSTAALDKYRSSGKGWQSRLNDDLVKLCGL